MRTTINMGRPNFVADHESIDRDTGHTIDWANVPERFRATPGQVVRAAATAAADAVTITVDPLEGPLTAGTLLYFGEAGEHTRVSANAAAGATSISVQAPHAAIEDGDEATVAGAGYKTIPGGTAMGDAGTDGKIYPRVETSNPAKFLLATDAVEDAHNHARHSYGVIVGGVIYENLLPEATGSPKVLPAAVKTELQTAGVGTGFSFKQYRDSTV